MRRSLIVLAFVGGLVLLAYQAVRSPQAQELRLPTGKNPGPLIVADLNGDRKQDIVVANMGDNTATIFLGDGTGAFTEVEGSRIPAGNSPNDIALGDFDRDENSDLAFANHERQHVTLLLGSGNGSFHPAPGSPFQVHSKPHVHTLAAADWNNDGHLDLVVDSWEDERAEVLFGDGKGAFRAPGPSFDIGKTCCFPRLRAADLNEDGNADLVTVGNADGRLRIFPGDGSGDFASSQAAVVTVPPRPFSFAIGDLNGDSRQDVIIAHYSGNSQDLTADGVSVIRGDGLAFAKSDFIQLGRGPLSVALGDINADGMLDAAVANHLDDSVTVLHGGRDGLTVAETIQVGREPFGTALADLNGDGRADLVVSNSGDNNIFVRFSN